MTHAITGIEVCPLCAGTAFIPHRFGLVRCTGCGLVVDRRIFAPELDRQLNGLFPRSCGLRTVGGVEGEEQDS